MAWCAGVSAVAADRVLDPERSRPNMAAAGGFRLAFWAEQRDHHAGRLDRALARYSRFAGARPPGWPESPIAAFATFLSSEVRRQDGPEHGMAYDVQRSTS